ncbi:UpxY family transcription antiterminator [Pollutibacter soli]|uniref:transcription termination/antitermination protein NusG n=1 Tax=Pollutibacter soli TaxID=3034157 RepID=UPI00301354A2
MEKEKYWYAVYTKPRWEKKVFKLLQQKSIESYCPLNKVSRKWSDRLKVIEEPLFKSYVFVQVAQEDLQKVRYIDGVLNFVYWQNKPARIRDEEIMQIKKFMSEFEDVEVVALDLKPFDEVMVNRGVLIGQTGMIQKVMQNSAEVVLESLGYKLVARFDKKSLAPVHKTKI